MRLLRHFRRRESFSCLRMKLWYFFRQIANGAWLSPVERLLREQEAGGSNPLAPTNRVEGLRYLMQPLVF